MCSHRGMDGWFAVLQTYTSISVNLFIDSQPLNIQFWASALSQYNLTVLKYPISCYLSSKCLSALASLSLMRHLKAVSTCSESELVLHRNSKATAAVSTLSHWNMVNNELQGKGRGLRVFFSTIFLFLQRGKIRNFLFAYLVNEGIQKWERLCSFWQQSLSFQRSSMKWETNSSR